MCQFLRCGNIENKDKIEIFFSFYFILKYNDTDLGDLGIL